MSPLIYLDNAATTRIDPAVLEAMLPYLGDYYGNPSSLYSIGRNVRLALETARKVIGELLGAKPSSIFFTSGGTESNNAAILSAIRDIGCDCIITSPIEHHAVLHTVDFYSRAYNMPLVFADLTSEGTIDYDDLEIKLSRCSSAGRKCLVSLMQANNETGCLLEMPRVAAMCKAHNAIFHSDCVQSIGHYPIDLQKTGVHFASASGHKFHGPKGSGILYVDNTLKIKPLIHGGGQERQLRAGTENVPGIIGFSKALELSMLHYFEDSRKIQAIKTGLKDKLQNTFPDVSFNSPDQSLYTVLSVCFPPGIFSDTLVFDLDRKNICISGGSACGSGSESHVMEALNKKNTCNTIRFSFSKYNCNSEIDAVVEELKRQVIERAPIRSLS